jgi:DNA-binding NtrC family response regulator
MAEVLLVDDEVKYTRILARVLQTEGHRVEVAHRPTEAIKKVQTRAFDVVVSDIRMPGMDGIALLTALREHCEDTDLVLMTAFATVESAVAAIRLGVRDYLLKPFPNQDLVSAVNRIEHRRTRLRERDYLRSREEISDPVGNSPAMTVARDQCQRLASSNITVLLRGETGSGKEVFARYIHRCSPRAAEPFIAVNVAALPPNLMEAELFGYERGAFTGADKGRPGKLEAAGRGTFFLDEVGEIPLELQAKLLRVLEMKEYRRLGGIRLRGLGARLVAATNRNLEEAVREGSFREDLYYRLNVAEVLLPPLRERPCDLPLLTQYFLSRQGHPPPVMTDEARTKLVAYDWPGNVRELSNVLQRAALLCHAGTIQGSDLRLQGPSLRPQNPSQRSFVSGESPDQDVLSEGFSLEDWELRWVDRALKQAGGVKTEAARLLGISRRQLDSRLRRLEKSRRMEKEKT